jgi:DNA-binding protein H-NS
MRKWEYEKIAPNETPHRGDEIDLLCDAGEDGWELVALLPNGVAYLKREVMDTLSESAEEDSNVMEQAELAGVEHAASNAHVKPKYRDPATGETWSGRGRMASWLKRKLDAGEDMDKYLV